MKDLSGNWKAAKLSDLCRIARGGSPRPIKKFLTSDPDGINWIKIGDTEVGGRYITSTRDKITSDGVSRSRFVEQGAFLLSNSMSFGRPYILRTSGCIHDGWLVLEPDYERVDQDYLYHVLSSPLVFRQFDSLAAGSTVRNLNIALVGKVTVPLPPLEEQRRIVAVLDEAFEGLARARANAEANLQNARELFESYLAGAFSEDGAGWKICELNEHVRFIDYRGKTPPKTESGTRLITAKNVKMGFIQREPEEFILESAYDGWMTRGFPKLGDVLFTTEAPLANVAQLDTEETVVIGQRLITMQADQSVVLPEFLKFSLMSPPMQREIRLRGTGATVVGIKAKLLKTVPLRFPKDLDRQRTIAAKCQSAYDSKERLEEAYRSKIKDLDDIRQSLLQQAFAGALT